MEFLLIASAHFLALLSPGPDFFLLMQGAFRLPLRYCFALCAGIALANGVYLLVAILGLTAVSSLSTLMIGLKYLGGTYLLFLGIMLLRAPRLSLEAGSNQAGIHFKSYSRQFTMGFLSALLNPKNAIFYLAIFSVMVSPETPLFIRGFYGCWMTFVVFFWDSLVVLFFNRQGTKDALRPVLYYLEKISGIVLAFFGLFLAFT
jgi:threonine/homoserine/homoserine lactone efflux protein